MSTKIISFIVAALLSLPILGGCVTMREGDEMRQSIITLTARVDNLQQVVVESNEKTSKSLGELNVNISRLMQTNQVSSASDHAALDRIKRDLRMLNGMAEKNGYNTEQTEFKLTKTIEGLERRIKVLEAKLGITDSTFAKTKDQKPGSNVVVTIPDEKLPDNEKDFYKQAKKVLLKDKNTIDGRRLMALFLKRYPKHKLADNARYWIGESYFMEKNYHQAVMEFQKVIDLYKKGDAVDDGLYMIGECFRKLGMKEDAKLFYQECLERFPKTGSARKAKAALKKL